MKVLHVIPSVALSFGGPAQVVYTTCRALRRIDIEVLIATDVGRELVYRGVPTIFFERELVKKIGYSHLFAKYSHSLAKWLEANVQSYDLVHIHDVFQHSTIAASRASTNRNIPYIIRPLGTLDPWSLKQKEIWKRIFLSLGLKKALRQSAAIHYTTEAEKTLAEQSLLLSKGIVIPNGVEIDDLMAFEQRCEGVTDAGESTDPYILVLARIHPKKGIDLLIRSFAQITKCERMKEWRLVIAGDGEQSYLSYLNELINQENILGKVKFVGWLSGDEKYTVLKNASLLALPSYQENFGVCLIESLFFHVPVFVSPYVNLARKIEDADVGWVTEMNVQSMIRLLTDILANPLEMKRKGQKGRHFAEEFAVGNVANQLSVLYQSIISSSQGGKHRNCLRE
jgi:glycosyltransferase involved in cell wall biosynthesis